MKETDCGVKPGATVRFDSCLDPQNPKHSQCINKILRILTSTPKWERSTINIYMFHLFLT